MATTLLKLKELSQQTIEAIIKSPDAWKKYLNAAPNIFRYSFEDQLLIYAQAPKATAVATYDVWNKIMHRAVKKGSCGIGLIHTKRRYEKIDYVFDVTQTAEKYDSRSLNIWKVTEKNETLVRTYLQNTIDIEEGMESIPELVHELIKESVDDVIDDLQDALKEDVPWKPSDIEQQEGRILRQGNQNEKVQIFRYVTEGTFDSYMWQLLENKQKFVGQIMTSKSPVRSCEDVDEAVLSFAEIKALATGNPYIKEKMELDIEVAKLKVLKANHNANRYRLENQIVHDYPLKISNEKVRIQQLQEDLKCYQSYQMKNQDRFEMIIENVTFDDKELAGKAIRTAAKKENRLGESVEIGTYQGFTMFVSYNHISNSYNLKLQNQRSYLIELGENGLGNIIRINNALDNIPKHIARAKQNLQTYESQLEDAKIEVMKEFPKEADLKEKIDRLSELNALLNMDQSNHEIVAEEQIEEQETEEVTNKTQRNEVVPKFGTR